MRRILKCCIDSCVWVKYAGHHKSSTLLDLIAKNNLLVYADSYLLSEIHEALITEFNFTSTDAVKALSLISEFLIIVPPRNIYRLAKDPKDNFLYDLCIQNNCHYLITIDKSILSDNHAPFLRKTDSWLKRRKKR